MAVTIRWDSDNTGSAVEQPSAHSDTAAGGDSADQTIYLSHDGTTEIQDCALYLAPKSGAYTGDASALEDFEELLSWGDETLEDDFGGVMVNMNATGSWSDGWAAWNAKDPTYGFVCRTSVADTESNAQTLLEQTGADSDGVLQEGGVGINVRFQVRVRIPTNETNLGKRQFDLVLSYTETS